MEPVDALADLKEISSQVEHAVIVDADGNLVASTLESEERSREIARLAHALVHEAETVRAGGDAPLAQLEAALRAGSVFLVRHGDWSIVATTPPEPTIGLVFYDLKSCLRSVDRGREPDAAA